MSRTLIEFTDRKSTLRLYHLMLGAMFRENGIKGVTVFASDGKRFAFDTEELAHMAMYDMSEQDYVLLYE